MVRKMSKNPKGLIQVYTGDGKGKTTAALGLALRAIGHGLKVKMIQFMKGGIEYGELEAAKTLGRLFDIIPMGRPDFVDKQNPEPIDIEWAKKGIALAGKIIKKAECNILILDEILVAIDYKLIPFDDVLALMDSKPPDMELVLTGRCATPEIIAKADLVTEMLEIKHYYRSGILSRRGFDH